MSIASRLHDVIAVIAPIQGVSIGRNDDKATWRIDWVGTPTPPVLAQAQAAINAFDVAAAEAKDAAAEALVKSDYKMFRVIEDIFDALAAKNVLKKSDLPQSAADIIDARKAERAKL